MQPDVRIVLCEACGGEGHRYSGHPNDPHPVYCGPCPHCGGKGDVTVEVEPIEMDDLDMGG